MGCSEKTFEVNVMNLQVLVADDSKTMRQIVVRGLKGMGIDAPVEAVDGDHALVMYELNDFDLVLTDWEMPGMTGLELLTEIHGREEKTPVVMLTTMSEKQHIMKAIEAGAEEYLLKPLNPKTFSKLENICRRIEEDNLNKRKKEMMKVQYINPFITATNFVFQNMLDCTPSRGEAFFKSNHQPRYEVSSVIELSGNARGTVVLTFSRDAALGAAGAVLPRAPHVLNDSVIDVIGELANIIVGNAQRELRHYDLTLSPPQTMSGRTNAVEFPDNVTPLCVPMDSPWGPLALEIGFVEQSANRLEELEELEESPAA